MLRLHCQSRTAQEGEPFVARVTTNRHRPLPVRAKEAILLGNGEMTLPEGFRAYLTFSDESSFAGDLPVVFLPDDLSYLDEGDIVRVSPETGDTSVLYRRCSSSNTIFLTESCNCRCILCPQPPRTEQDEVWASVWLEAIPLMDQDTAELGISGGEPTVRPKDLLKIITACRNFLPRTAVHLLSNGRMFNYMSLCQDLAAIGHLDLMVGVTLYSDLAHVHDQIMQATGAFDQTIRGIMNLARLSQRVELRTVVVRHNFERLPEWSRFVARDLPFVSHVALMGLEPIGYARMNIDSLWVDPAEYQEPLREAVRLLAERSIAVSVYNHPLCVLDEDLWCYARQSISDWKTEYLPECDSCTVQSRCGGMFTSALDTLKPSVRPL